METFVQTLRRTAGLIVGISLASLTVFPQQQKKGSIPVTSSRAGPHERSPTFETLLASDTYEIYVEVRGVGQLVGSPGVNDLVDPVLKFASAPREFKTIVKWLQTHSLELSGARMLFASWPAERRLPDFVCAVEFPSDEEAQRFEPQLRSLVTKVLPASEANPGISPGGANRSTPPQHARGSESTTFIVRQTGSLILISPSKLVLGELRPKGSKLLTEEQNFLIAHSRLTAEPIFVYFNVGLEDKSVPTNRITSDPRGPTGTVEMSAQPVTVNGNDPDVAAAPTPQTVPANAVAAEEATAPPPALAPSPEEPGVTTSDPNGQKSGSVQEALSAMLSLFSAGTPSWPDSIAAALAIESESYDVRLLLINSDSHKALPVPFIPQLISGSPLAPSAPSVFPADTQFLMSFSLDFDQIYDRMLKAQASENDRMSGYKTEAVRDNRRETPFAVLERILGIKLKEDVVPLFGNEAAISLPLNDIGLRPPNTTVSVELSSAEKSSETNSPPIQTAPVFAISLINNEAVRELLPRLIDSVGLKGATLLAKTEKRNGTELVSYGNLFSYLFVEDFLLFTSDVETLRHIADSYSNHDTLAASNHFRNGTQWQPRQLLGQLYVSPALMESYRSFFQRMNSERLQGVLSRLSPVAEPVTYALSNEGPNLLHEIHIPRSLAMLTVAGLFGEVTASPIVTNEVIAQSMLRTIASAEETYKATAGDGRFGTLDELISQGLISRDYVEKNGYRLEVNNSSTSFEASAVPIEYGKTGKLSFFIDQTSVMRAGDHGGGPATVTDSQVR